MTRAIVLVLLLTVALALSGCAKKNNDEPGSSSSSTTSGTASTSTTSTSATGTGSSLPGTIVLNFTRDTPNGPIPLAVNFSLNASFVRSGAAQPAPAGLQWSIQVFNGTNATGNATPGPQGSSLPAKFALNFTNVGDFVVRAVVVAPTYAGANATIQVAAIAGGSSAPLFFDGAEGDTSQWTLQSRMFFNPNLDGTTGQREFAFDHPEGGWTLTGEPRTGAKSWAHPYPDNYRARMTSVAVTIPEGGATLSYALKGGAEATGVEGLFVLVGPDGETRTVQALHNGVIADWTVFTLPLSAGDMRVEFRFDSDISCSNDSAAPPGFSCGAGYDAGGFLLDDITIQ